MLLLLDSLLQESSNSSMDVFLMVRRKKTTIFLDAKETTTVLELKKMIEGITKKVPHDQQPAEVGLAFRGEEGSSGWEELEKTPYSTPPELPDVMKPGQDTAAQEQTVA